MLRFGKGFIPVLKVFAQRYLRYGVGTRFLCETNTQQTRLQKAIRQMQRELLSEQEHK